jgi:hypothetical protein
VRVGTFVERNPRNMLLYSIGSFSCQVIFIFSPQIPRALLHDRLVKLLGRLMSTERSSVARVFCYWEND